MTLSNNKQAYEIIITNLNPGIGQKEVMTLFEPFGKINNCDLQKNNENSSCFAVIQYENDSNANEAISKMDGQKINGNIISVKKTSNKSSETNESSLDNTEDTNNDADDVDDDDEFDDDGDSDSDSDDDDDDDDD